MAETTHDLPHIGREEIVDQLLDRLCRPDDLRESPKGFLHPGFYGLGGVGKSRLLQEVTARARAEKLTPYVLSIDFDPRAEVQPPATPLQFVQRLVDGLEAIDKAERPFWQRGLWGRVNPFRECRRLFAEAPKIIQQSQTVTAEGSSLAGITLSQVSSSQQVTPALAQAFGQALLELCADGKVEQLFGMRTAVARPLILLALDTVEAASRELRRWLETELESLWPGNGLHVHVLVVAAGRQRMTRLIESELPPLDEEAAGRFLVSYAAQRRREGAALAESDLSRLREPTPLRGELIRLGEGIPLLLMLLCDLFVDAPGAFEGLADLPALQEERIAYVIDHYLTRLRELAAAPDDDRRWDRYRLLWAGAVPRRLDGPGLLGALLADLPGTPYTARSNYDDLYTRLARQAFVSDRGREGLVYHQLVRAGVLAHLHEQEPARWQELHRRAAAWYVARGNRQEALYHRLQVESDAVWQEMRNAIEGALAAGNWPAAQGLIAAAKESDLPAGAAHWLTLYNTDLAWGEGNSNLAQRRLEELAGQELQEEIREGLARRLEDWFGLADPETETEGGAPERPEGMDIHLFLWWAQRRGHDRTVAHALLGLAQSARAQDQYDEARRRDTQALDISQRTGDQRGEANALWGLADSARAQSQYDEARRGYTQALDISQRIGAQVGEAHALWGLAQSDWDQSQYDEAHSYLANCLAIVEAIHIPVFGLSLTVVLGQRALDGAEAHARQGHSGPAAAARQLAQFCYDQAGGFLRDPDLSAAGQRYLQGYRSLGLRLAS